FSCYFFFQAEDGIRDRNVTGVQTCALPIFGSTNFGKEAQLYLHHDNQNHILHMMPFTFSNFSVDRLLAYLANQESYSYFGKHLRSEERRVGKECRSRW